MPDRARGGDFSPASQRQEYEMGMTTNITAHITATVWKIEKRVGDEVGPGDAVVILESMKMEMPVESPVAGKVCELRCAEGEAVEEGAVLAVVQ
jgi:acetyl-CoA carboxylase biotin carboxyl carrier protein